MSSSKGSASSVTKTLLLVRHAHRDTSDRDADNGLSEKGLRQAAALTEHYRRHYFEHARDQGVAVRSSLRRRCQETVGGIARLHHQDLVIDPFLMEQLPLEPEAHFLARLGDFERWWRAAAPVWTVASSHGDWIPLFLDRLLGKSIDLKKGALAEITLLADGSRPSLKSLMQEF